MTAIYQIKNLLDNKVYIGSSINFKERKYRHLKDLKKGKHHSVYLQRAWDKYGANQFVFEILELCKQDELAVKENFYFQVIKPEYNICPTAYSQVGRKLTKEHIEKLKAYSKTHNVRPPKSTYESKQVKVQMLDKETNQIINIFESLSEACRYLGKTSKWVSSITACCKGKRQTILGYRWEYVTT